jgi:hypothetical protein
VVGGSGSLSGEPDRTETPWQVMWFPNPGEYVWAYNSGFRDRTYLMKGGASGAWSAVTSISTNGLIPVSGGWNPEDNSWLMYGIILGNLELYKLRYNSGYSLTKFATILRTSAPSYTTAKDVALVRGKFLLWNETGSSIWRFCAADMANGERGSPDAVWYFWDTAIVVLRSGGGSANVPLLRYDPTPGKERLVWYSFHGSLDLMGSACVEPKSDTVPDVIIRTDSSATAVSIRLAPGAPSPSVSHSGARTRIIFPQGTLTENTIVQATIDNLSGAHTCKAYIDVANDYIDLVANNTDANWDEVASNYFATIWI